jgi:hypothetical protein
MASLDHMRIKLGPGAQILEDAPENEELLAEIQNTAPATTSDLFKLSLFYQSYWVQRPLARHLSSLALRELIGLSKVQEALKAAVFANFDSSQAEWWDQVEDYWAGYDPNDPEDRDRPRFARSTQTALWVLYSGIGMLIEKNTRYSAAGEGVTSYYILGNCPNPANMTIEFLTKSNL